MEQWCQYLKKQVAGFLFWIDMETKVRSEDDHLFWEYVLQLA